jgi:transcriptional regulator with XRE-family HTH domain
MTTIGERIRKARLQRGWSGAELAKRAGYKTQSGISNLENRSTGSGGHKVAHIAKVLGVPLEWIISGPDSENVPLYALNDEPKVAIKAESPVGVYKVTPAEDPRTVRLLTLWGQLDDNGKADLLERIEFFAAGRRPHQDGQALSVAGR